MTISSIPSKFETTFINAKENDGFGTKSFRFTTSESDTPGPGRYDIVNNRNADSSRNTRSRNGYTPMASRTDRFNARTAEIDMSRPGPGTYYVAKISIGVNTPGPVQKYHPPSQSMSCYEPQKPGPGTYNLNTSTKSDRQRSRKESSFMSDNIDRFKAPKTCLNPCPGDYNVVNATDFLLNQGNNPSGKLGMGCFRSGSKRSQYLNPGDQVPGPGYYTERAATAPNAVRNSPMFSNVTTDRFGKPYKYKPSSGNFGVAPGPGWYTSSKSTFNDDGGFRKGLPAFRDTGDRFDASTSKHKMARAPGPSYYQPSTPQRQSFMLNVKNRFV